MSTRWYPLYQRGNPQLRVFLPNFWMKLIRPSQKVPENVVVFQTSLEMTSHDVKNYMEKIYQVKVVDVETEIKMGKTRKCPEQNYIIKDDDYKEAKVTLPKNEKFVFPDIFPDKMKDEMKSLEKMKEQYNELEKRNAHRPGVPGWFSL